MMQKMDLESLSSQPWTEDTLLGVIIILPSQNNALLKGKSLKIAIIECVLFDSPPKWVPFNDPCFVHQF